MPAVHETPGPRTSLARAQPGEVEAEGSEFKASFGSMIFEASPCYMDFASEVKDLLATRVLADT